VAKPPTKNNIQQQKAAFKTNKQIYQNFVVHSLLRIDTFRPPQDTQDPHLFTSQQYATLPKHMVLALLASCTWKTIYLIENRESNRKVNFSCKEK
jgi:hypothetical protein